MPASETHEFDVVVIGAGGAGLRAAIEARQRGLRTAVVCKSVVATLFLASAAAAILLVFSPSIGAPLTTFFVLAGSTSRSGR